MTHTACCALQETLYVGLQDTRMQAFKLPLIMDAPAGVAANGATAALDSLADGALPGECHSHLRCRTTDMAIRQACRK